MKPSRLLCTLVCASGLLLPAAGVAQPAAADAVPEQLMQLLGPRPDIDAYSNRDDFVRDVLAWEKHRQQLEQAWRNGALSLEIGSGEPGGHDWHEVTGPEDLDTAVRNASGYQQPHYREPYRFNRTTHISFPLDPLAPDQMATRVVESPGQLTEDPEEVTARQLAEQELVTVDEAGYLVLAPAPQPDSLPRVGQR